MSFQTLTPQTPDALAAYLEQNIQPAEQVTPPPQEQPSTDEPAKQVEATDSAEEKAPETVPDHLNPEKLLQIDAEKEAARKKQETAKPEAPEEEDPFFQIGKPKSESSASAPDDKKKYEELSAKAQQYEALTSDPEIKAILEAKKNGKSIIKALSEIKGTDWQKASAKDIFQEKLKQSGLSEDLIQQALTSFESKEEWEQTLEVAEFRKSLVANQDKELSAFLSQSTEQELAARKAAIEQQTIIANKAKAELQEIKESLVGKKVLGLEVTPEMADKVVHSIETGEGLNFQHADGTWNTGKLFRLALLDQNIELMHKTWKTQNVNKGREEVIQQVTRPSLNTTVHTPPEESLQSKEEREQKEITSELTRRSTVNAPFYNQPSKS